MKTSVLRVAPIALLTPFLVVTLACERAARSPAAPSAAGGAQEQSIIPPNPSPNPRQADLEFFELCKDFSTGSGPAVTFDVAVDVGSNGGSDQRSR
jgi:hypothetical protein